MSNNYFQFRQFIVRQERAAMKVCTDACLFGAWAAATFPNAEKVLDIGTGTALLALMYVQKNTRSLIDAIEIDEQAFQQAVENTAASPWAGQLNVYHSSLQDFPASAQYDLIISNPPFFENDLHSENDNRNKAMHGTSLRLDELVSQSIRHLSAEGSFAVLLPYHRAGYFQGLAEEAGLALQSVLHISQSPSHGFFRSILGFSKRPGVEINRQSMSIKDAGNGYSAGFVGLLKDYYLYL